METKATVVLEVNGKQAESELDIIKTKLKELHALLDDAQKRNDKLSVRNYSNQISILEKRLLS